MGWRYDQKANIPWLEVGLLLIAAVFLIFLTGKFINRFVFESVTDLTGPTLSESGQAIMTPSQLTANPRQYTDQTITVRAKLKSQLVACENKSCSPEDRYCGCPLERQIILADVVESMTRQEVIPVKLVGKDGQAFCHRRLDTTDYDCGNWQINGIYDINGNFSTINPSSGTPTQFGKEFWLMADSGAFIQSAGGGNWIASWWQTIRQNFNSWRRSAGFVID